MGAFGGAVNPNSDPNPNPNPNPTPDPNPITRTLTLTLTLTIRALLCAPCDSPPPSRWYTRRFGRQCKSHTAACSTGDGKRPAGGSSPGL